MAANTVTVFELCVDATEPIHSVRGHDDAFSDHTDVVIVPTRAKVAVYGVCYVLQRLGSPQDHTSSQTLVAGHNACSSLLE